MKHSTQLTPKAHERNSTFKCKHTTFKVNLSKILKPTLPGEHHRVVTAGGHLLAERRELVEVAVTIHCQSTFGRARHGHTVQWACSVDILEMDRSATANHDNLYQHMVNFNPKN